jgi:hypothetical protein
MILLSHFSLDLVPGDCALVVSLFTTEDAKLYIESPFARGWRGYMLTEEFADWHRVVLGCSPAQLVVTERMPSLRVGDEVLVVCDQARSSEPVWRRVAVRSIDDVSEGNG